MGLGHSPKASRTYQVTALPANNAHSATPPSSTSARAPAGETTIRVAGDVTAGGTPNTITNSPGIGLSRGNKRPFNEGNTASKRSKSTSDDVFCDKMNSNEVSKLLKDECSDLLTRFKQAENALIGHAKMKGDIQMETLIGLISTANSKLQKWSQYMFQELANITPKETSNVRAPPPPPPPTIAQPRRRSTIRSVSFETSTKDNLYVGKTYSSVVADNLVKDNNVMNLPKVFYKPRVNHKKDDNIDKVRKTMEGCSKAVTILDFDFGKTLRSKDVMHEVFNNKLVKNLKNNICKQPDADLVKDDLYMINDAIDCIQNVEFMSGQTAAKSIQRDDKLTLIYTCPITIHFYNKTQRNIFEKYLRLFSGEIIVPFWHSSLVKVKNSIKEEISRRGYSNVSIRPMNKFVISAHHKDENGKRRELFVYDPITCKYTLGKIEDKSGKWINGSDLYREENNINKSWNTVLPSTEKDNEEEATDSISK